MLPGLAALPLVVAACAVQTAVTGPAPADTDLASPPAPAATNTESIAIAEPLPSATLHEAPPPVAPPEAVQPELTVTSCTHTGNNLTYCNGQLIGNANFVPITWTPAVFSSVALDIVPFLDALYSPGTGGSQFLSWLNEYSENGNNLTFATNTGRWYNINPQNTSKTLSGSNIATELSNQFDAGTLPSPDAWNNIYIVNFPPGYTLTNGNKIGCNPSGPNFTGYHTQGSWHGVNFRFIVMPDYSPGSPCIQSFSGGTSVSSYEYWLTHEVAETVTDPDQQNGWLDGSSPTNQEIGDKCQNITGGTFVSSSDQSVHEAQMLWANDIGGCFVQHTRDVREETQQGTFDPTQTYLVGDFNGDGKKDVATVWGDGSSPSQNGIDVRVNTGSTGTGGGFSLQPQWGRLGTQGVFAADEQFMVGDFDGDGWADIIDGWNAGGRIAIDVHRNNHNGTFTLYSQVGAAGAQGGWSDSWYWVPGDFDGNGRTDVAVIWSNNGNIAIDLHFSTGNLGYGQGFVFEPQVASAAYQGALFAGQHWFAGDVNVDGRTDLIDVWNDGGQIAIDTHVQNPPCTSIYCLANNMFAFTSQYGAAGTQGYFDPTMQWMAGDFDGNGSIDLADAFGDYVTAGAIDVDVHLTNQPDLTGRTATLQRFTTRQGSWWAGQKWFAGDFNGDGRTEFGLSFADNNQVDIDVHMRGM